MALIFDTHAHYDDEQFDKDRDYFLQNLENFKVAGAVNVGADLKSSRGGVELARQFERIFAAVGVHPGSIEDLAPSYLSELKGLAAAQKVVAIGEIGLDYHYKDPHRPGQIKCFEAQLELAKTLNLPVIVHSREACEDTLAVLKNAGCPKLVVHCFSYSLEVAQQLLELGCYFGFTGVITFKNAKKAQEVLKMLPSDRILIETDCPYMAPEPCRGQRCDSSMLRFTLEKIAQERKVSTQEAEAQLNQNASEFYGIEIKAG